MSIDDAVSIAIFAARVGKTRQAVEKAIRRGRLVAYDAAGAPLPPAARGRKILRLSEALAAWRASRSRIDDDVLSEIDGGAPEFTPAPAAAGVGARSLTQAKTEKEALLVEQLKQRMARERGELISRAATLDAFEAVGAAVRAKLNGIPAWAEEAESALRGGGFAALARLLQAKTLTLQTEIAETLENAARVDEAAGEDQDEDAADLG